MPHPPQPTSLTDNTVVTDNQCFYELLAQAGGSPDFLYPDIWAKKKSEFNIDRFVILYAPVICNHCPSPPHTHKHTYGE